MTKKDLVPLPHAPHETIKVTAGKEIVWQQNPRDLYSHELLPQDEYSNAVDMPNEVAYGFAGLMLAIPGIVIDAILGATGVLPHDGVIMAVITTIAGLPVGGVLLGTITGFSQRRNARKLRAAIKSSFSAWVNERYNLHTTADTFTDENLSYLMSTREWKGSEFKSDGKRFRIRRDEDNHIYIEEQAPKVITDYRPEASIAALEDPEPPAAVTTLTGEAAVLSEKIFDLLKLLADFDLTTEAAHTVKRVREDLQTTLDLHRNLTKLGEVHVDSQQLVTRTLTALGTELDEIIAAERDAINRQLLVQQRYVEDRKRKSADPALTLDQPAATVIEPKAKQAV